ncbi:hypothetical protein [Aureimonas leprariae]|uniref:Uncharacterized protein n=1 Tax=Plantimonas leprariae TaxID=2615207 RepID=A0A7V7PNR1_9HYPH|nr:hypothetical protein [Aureimonas leprariae]KAB0679516.1 hypothetical protein F6X38_11855 [Aureimonas leprariae]
MRVARFTNFATVEHFQMTGPGATPGVKLSDYAFTQITGPETSFTWRLERSTLNPETDAPNWVPWSAPDHGSDENGVFTKNLSDPGAGFGVREPAVAWWRVVILTMTGASALVSISGGGA